MDADKLNKWAEQLLDLAKRNNLISFHDAKLSTAEIVVPNAADLFDKVMGGSTFEVFNPKDVEKPVYDEEEDEEEEVFAQLSIPEDTDKSGKKKEKLSRDEYIERYKKFIKRNKILLYSSTADPMVALKNIDKKAKSAIDETGVNTAYLAFGFVHWKGNGPSSDIYRAPLLLIPVTFKNESSVEPYYMIPAEDELIINPTFSYKVSAEDGIKLPELDEDENLTSYLARIAELVEKKEWTVSADVKLGIFSFQKINMYHDLKENQEEILKNKNVKALLGSVTVECRASSEVWDSESHVKNELVDLHTVVDADSSQIEAIEMAKSGKSFVLQGPPGTGKSQTITNLIAECLADGKKVLFVSEKLAALNVVFDKLKQAELEDFCLELHSHKANKKTVIEELCRVLDLQKAAVSQWVNNEVEAKIRAQEQLNNYEIVLHKPQSVIEMTPYQLYSAYSRYRAVPDVNYAIKGIDKKDRTALAESVRLLGEYADFVPSIGEDYRKNVWYGYHEPEGTYLSDIEVDDLFMKALETVRRLDGRGSKLSAYGIKCNTPVNMKPWIKARELFSKGTILHPVLFNSSALSVAESDMTKAASLAQKIKSLEEEINAEYTASVYDFNGHETLGKLKDKYSGFMSHLFNSEYKQILAHIQGTVKDDSKVNYQRAVELMEKLSSYQANTEEFTLYDSIIRNYLGSFYRSVDTDWQSVFAAISDLKSILDGGLKFGTMCKLSHDAFDEIRDDILEDITEIEKAFHSGEEALAFVAALFETKCFNVMDSDTGIVCRRLEDCVNNASKRDSWKQFRYLLKEMEDDGLCDYIDFVIENQIAPDKIADTYSKAFYRQWIQYVFSKEPVLATFNRINQDRAVKTFADKDNLQFEINKKKLKAELSAKRPNTDMVAAGSPIQVLRREGAKKKRQKNIRQLILETGELVQILKPCFLMSPLSVSTFLAPGSVHFDVVIFDEASQIFPQDAVGAIYRGDQLIVVGDSKQMPPTNFFNASIEDENYNEDEDDSVTDFESILELCAVSMPEQSLKWHYRSRFEELIAFSNQNFYRNALVTFPSSKGNRKGNGVDYVYVDGAFDRQSKTNRKEAERVVELVFENINKYPKRSLGVVAFSVSQQDLIESLISKRREADLSAEWYFRQEMKEPFFVKNLETVQGDERDTIIFSVAYGKDAQGRILMNFGPLNRAGGERRLNVAVTRAKENVILVSSMHCGNIDLTRTQSLGAKLLHDYLDYAEHGSIALQRTVNVSNDEWFDSEFEMEVYDFLKDKGYSVDLQVGCSSFRIDLGLKIPDTSDYVLAIECDGASYHSSRNARDRDRLRQDVLERMGWKFYRIWSTDWFKNKEIEKQNLLKACEEALSNPHKADADDYIEQEKKEKLIARMETAVYEESQTVFPIYEEVSFEEIAATFTRDFRGTLLDILDREAPQSVELLLRRLAPFYGRERVTKVVRENFEYQFRYYAPQGVVRKDGFLYLADQKNFELRVPAYDGIRRDVLDIAPEELGAGMLVVIKQNISITKDGLYKTINNLLGYNRLSDNISNWYDNALVSISKEITRDGDRISLKKS